MVRITVKRILVPVICTIVLCFVAYFSNDSEVIAPKQAKQLQRYETPAVQKETLSVQEESLPVQEESLPVQEEPRTIQKESHAKNPTNHSKFSSIQSDRWIVVTTIAYPTPDVQFLSQIPGWKLVVVGDTKTPVDWSYPNCIYLSIDDQLQLGFETVPLLPKKSYARKNVGHLFAIAHGAKFIYETDDDNRPLDRLKNFILESTTSGLVYGGKDFFNPYRHFGQSTLWPRGYPLGSVGENITTTYRLGKWKTPSIQQGVVNGDPDMDAIFRLTRKQTDSVLNVTFDQRAPPAIVPHGVFSPFNSQNTMFLYDALWALLLPTTTTFRVCDIWRGYWAQRLLWEIGGNLGFFPPNAFQKRNSHSYLSDAAEETNLYFQTEHLLEFMKNWRCDPEKKFFDCVIKLSSDMDKGGFWGKHDAALTSAWIKDLRSIGYTEPERITFPSLVEGVVEISNQRSIFQMTTHQKTNLTYWAAEQVPPLIYGSYSPQRGLLSHIHDVAALCDRDTTVDSGLKVRLKMPVLASSSLTNYPDILLVVVFSHPYYQSIEYLETIYRAHIPHIVYCGNLNTRAMFDNATRRLKSPVTFMEVDIQGGMLGQRCLTEAIKMRYDVDGYLYIDGNTVFNTWYIHNLPTDRLWLFNFTLLHQEKLQTDLGRENKHVPGLSSFHEAVEELRSLDKKGFDVFYQNLNKNTGMTGAFCKGRSNVAYVPRKYKDYFVYLMEHFTKHKLLAEMAFPTVFVGLEWNENIFKIPDTYLLYNRSDVSYGNVEPTTMHQRVQSFFCKTYLPSLLTQA